MLFPKASLPLCGAGVFQCFGCVTFLLYFCVLCMFLFVALYFRCTKESCKRDLKTVVLPLIVLSYTIRQKNTNRTWSRSSTQLDGLDGGRTTTDDSTLVCPSRLVSSRKSRSIRRMWYNAREAAHFTPSAPTDEQQKTSDPKGARGSHRQRHQ